jgi:hypothetical protein
VFSVSATTSEALPLRSVEELSQRLLCLWAVTGTAYHPDNSFFGDYIRTKGLEKHLSGGERSFLYSSARSREEIHRFTWMHECVYVLAWCGSLLPSIQLPNHQSQLGDAVMDLFPEDLEQPDALRRALCLRAAAEVHSFTEQVYHAHWRIRDAKSRALPAPDGLDGEAIQEWHLALNWMTKYEDEDNWDAITTDT